MTKKEYNMTRNSRQDFVYKVEAKNGTPLGEIASCSMSHARYEAKQKFGFSSSKDFDVFFTGRFAN